MTASEGPKCGAAKRQGGGLCRRAAGAGTDHLGYGQCNLHTGATVSGRRHAETLRRDAWARILELTDPALNALASLVDNAEAEEVRLRAARDILDRAGLGARHVHEISGPAGGPIPIEVRAADLLARAKLLRPVAKPKPRSKQAKLVASRAKRAPRARSKQAKLPETPEPGA